MKTPSKRISGFLAVAGLGLIVILAVPSKESGPQVAAPQLAAVALPPGQVGPPSPPASGPTPEQLDAQRARSRALAWGRDPFRPPGTRPVQSSPEPASPSGMVRLTGISTMEGERIAIVDRQVVREGDSLHSGHKVLQITAEAVTLSMHEESLTLTMKDHR